MKKIVISGLFLFTVTIMYAQTKPVKKTTTATTSAPLLKTLEDSASYAMGLSFANFYKQQGVSKINGAIVSRAINDAMSGKPLLMNDAQTNNVLMTDRKSVV